MRGWHNESQRHSLAARGFRTVGNKFVYEPNRRRSIPLLYYGELESDGKYHLIKDRVWEGDVRGRGVNVTGLLASISRVAEYIEPEEGEPRKYFGSKQSLYTKKKPEHGFGYIIEPEKNRIRATQIIDMDDDVFSKYSARCWLDRFVDDIREKNPEHKVVAREIDLPISRLSRENPNSYFAGMRYAFDNEGDLLEHVLSFMSEYTGPKMNYITIRSYKNRQSAFNDWKSRNRKIDSEGTESEYTKWLRIHERKLEV